MPVARRAFAAAGSHKVSIIQDMQIPKDEAIKALEDKGFEVEWAVDKPSDAWAICTVNNAVTKEVLDRHPQCKVVSVSFTGVNHVDLEACKERGITVTNTPSYSTDAVAELAVAMALAVYRELLGGERTMRGGGWLHSAGGFEVRNKTIGIVGLGEIGQRVGEIFRVFKPKEILGWSRRERSTFAAPPISGRQTSLEELFEHSDIITLHCPLVPDTKHLVNRALLERLRPKSILINTARGGIIDEEALVDLLCQRRFHAGLDVFETEPVPQDAPILSKVPPEQVVLTPHVAYKTYEALTQRMEITAQNLWGLVNGQPQNVVLKP